MQSVATEVEPIEIPPALAADDLPSMPLDDFALPEAGSPGTMYPWSAAIDQLQAYVAEAGLLYDSEPEVERAEPPDAELPWVEVLPSLPAVAEEPAPAVEAPPPMWEIELDGPVAEFTEKPNSPEAKLPVIAPAALDPYAATAQAILRQLPRDRSQVLLFTSAADGQGKTMTLARLALWLAQGMEGNVLVVDANFRNPDLARWLAVAPAWRLPDVLAGTADWSAAVQATAERCVSLLPGGSDAQGRGAGRNVQGMSRLLRDLAGHYDLVVVDAPSLAHRGTVQLAAVCDGTYLVARLGDGSPRMLREAAQVVQANGGRLLGCVAIDAE